MSDVADKKRRVVERIGFGDANAPPADGRLIKSDFHFEDGLNPDPARDLRPAAVLIPIFERDHDLTILLTRRADHLDSHSGQVAFPGGKMHDEDATPLATALRETHEEVGIAADAVDLVGELETYETGTGFIIRPFVGFVDPGVRLALDPGEVAEAFEVPFAFLMDPANHTRERMFWRGKMREYYEMPYNGQRIWGATAAMLVNFYTRLYGS
jgi:8-oxo-dGTP pyrophosphatase MutT (NUDIX family)